MALKFSDWVVVAERNLGCIVMATESLGETV